LMRLLLEGNLAVYGSHLPLDLHPRLGNNVRLASALGLRNLKPFFYQKDQHLGVQAVASVPLKDLKKRLQLVVRAEPTVLPGGPPVCRRIGVVTGGAGSEVKRAADEGVDTFITGEGRTGLLGGAGTARERPVWRVLRDGDIWGERRWLRSWRRNLGCRGSLSIIRAGCELTDGSSRELPDANGSIIDVRTLSMNCQSHLSWPGSEGSHPPLVFPAMRWASAPSPSGSFSAITPRLCLPSSTRWHHVSRIMRPRPNASFTSSWPARRPPRVVRQ
jgi:hypothetical protein